MKKGFTCGAFDLLHAGHVLMLKEIREQCDFLIVGLHSDPNIDRPEKNKPVETIEERKIRLEGCKYIDEIILYDTEADLYNLLKKINPDVRFVGSDWKEKHFTGDDLPIQTIFNTRDHGYSSTSLRKRIFYQEQKQYGPEQERDMNLKISIILPTYNGEKYIKRAIESVIAQSFSDWGLIVVDDFSRDNTIQIVKELQEKDNRIKLITLDQNSGGPALPKNEGFKVASGEYIAYLDQDDEWLPNKLEEQIKFFENSTNKKLALVSCGVNLINTNGKCFGSFIPVKKSKLLPEILLRNPIYSNSSVMLKREVVESVGGRDCNMKYSEDLEMWIRIASHGYDFGYIYKPLFKYYFHENNVTGTVDKTLKVRDMEYSFNKHKDLYKKYNYVHVGLFRIGVMYFLARDYKKGREFFVQSLKENKIFIPSYFGYIFSWLGNMGINIINALIFFYRLFRGKKYLLFSK